MPSLAYNIHYELFALFLTVLIYIELCLCMPKHTQKNRLFRRMTQMVIVTTVFDLLSAFTNVMQGMRVLTLLINTGYFSCGLLLCHLLHDYVERAIIPEDGKHIAMRFNRVLLAVLEALMVVNLFTGWLFGVTPEGEYYHGPLFMLQHIASMYYVLCTSVALFINRRRLSFPQQLSSYLFVALFLLGLLLQTFVWPDVLLIMPTVALMLLVATFSLESPDYVQLQKALQELTLTKQQLEIANEKYYQAAYNDLMTGLKNRSAYMTRLRELEEQKPLPATVVLIADLNDLKRINDDFGHQQGDEALVQVAQLLQGSFGEGYECYRIGGDEFAVLGQHVTAEAFQSSFAAFRSAVKQANENTPYPVLVATGYQFVDDLPLEEAIRQADEKMYQNKKDLKVGLG